MKKKSPTKLYVLLFVLTFSLANFIPFYSYAYAASITNPKEKSNLILQQKYPETLILKGIDEGNKIALTFDDGPDPKSTPYILDTLKMYGVKATFFVLGSYAKAHPEILKRIDREGHVIGNHTNSHLILVNHNERKIREEILITENIINDVIGYKPTLFRAPYGALNEDAISILKQMNNTVVGWSVDSLDWWKSKSQAEITVNVISDSEAGSIILFHDLKKTANILQEVIPLLQERGMQFVTVTELIGIEKSKNSLRYDDIDYLCL